MKFTFDKTEKLKSEKLIEKLFLEGKSVVAYPLRLVYTEIIFEEMIRAKVGVSVSKRHFKRAVDRNRIKRQMREAYRLQKASFFNNSSSTYALMILYIGKEKSDFETLKQKTKHLFDKFLQQNTTDKTHLKK